MEGDDLAADGPAVHESAFQWGSSTDAGQDIAVLAEQVRAMRQEWLEPIEAIGVAMPATVDGSGRVVAWPGRPSWVGLDLGAALRALFPGARVAWADDGDLAALAEANEAGCADLVYLGVGTGIGGGIVLDGRPCPGLTRGSCEIGHVVVDRSGPRCDCGRHGCLQAVASGPATLRRAAELRGGTVTFAALREAFLAGKSWAVAAVSESCAALAVAVTGLSELLHPSLALIGGGFAAALPGFVPMISKHATDLGRPAHPPTPIREAALGGLSSLHGAVALARIRSGLAPQRRPQPA